MTTWLDFSASYTIKFTKNNTQLIVWSLLNRFGFMYLVGWVASLILFQAGIKKKQTYVNVSFYLIVLVVFIRVHLNHLNQTLLDFKKY